VPKWQKSMLFAALEKGHCRGVFRAANQVLAMGAAAGLAEEELVFARRARREALRHLDAKAAE
jgi:hypothetical protein